jgi:hypothetical protein
MEDKGVRRQLRNSSLIKWVWEREKLVACISVYMEEPNKTVKLLWTRSEPRGKTRTSQERGHKLNAAMKCLINSYLIQISDVSLICKVI